MKEYINAFRILVCERRLLFNRLWRSYFATVCAAAWCMVGFLHLIPAYLVPKLLLQDKGFSQGDAYWLASFPYVEMGIVAVGLVCWGIASLWAHKQTLKVLPEFVYHELLTSNHLWSRTKYVSMITLSIILFCSVFLLVALPLLVLFFCGISASYGVVSDVDSLIPIWAYLLAVLFSVLGMSILMLTLLFIRFSFLQNNILHD